MLNSQTLWHTKALPDLGPIIHQMTTNFHYYELNNILRLTTVLGLEIVHKITLK